jgi:hypothetical protein
MQEKRLVNFSVGPVVRTAPNTLSFTSPKALHQIYGSNAANVRKSTFYKYLDGGSTTHTEIDKEKHSARRRTFNIAFSDAALKEAEGFIVEHVGKWIKMLGPESGDVRRETPRQEGDESIERHDHAWSPSRDMTEWCNWLAYDIMGSFVFGKTYNCLLSDEYRWMPTLMTQGTKFGYWV